MSEVSRLKNVLDHIAELALRSPGAVASYDPSPMTRGQLALGSARLETTLRAVSGVDRPVVGVCAHRGNPLLMALIAVLRTGGTYLPLNPDLPARRLAAMVDDATPDVVVTDGDLRFGDIPLLPLEPVPSGHPADTGSTPVDTAAADSFHYLLYTSGSTGRPKGVLSGQPGLLNRLTWMRDALGVSPDDRVLQKTPVSFDVSLWELLWPLMYGAPLVFAKPGGHVDGRYLRAVVRDQGVTVLHFVPSMLRSFLRVNPGRGADPALTSVRLLVTSGEALTGDLAAEALERFGSARLANLYGPTEASIDATHHLVGPEDLVAGPVPIGRPITGMAAHVVDGSGRPVAPGEVGELWLSGVGLARGYVNLPDVTAAAFVEDPPFVAADRAYRTGDLAREREDGVLEFLGRTDRQVKFRGVRVELGELDAALAGYPGVDSAHTVVSSSSDVDRLVSFVHPVDVVLASAGAGDGTFFRWPAFAAELREHLMRLLPAAVVPTHVVFVREWPVSGHGKVDGKRLLDHVEDLGRVRRPTPAGAAGESVTERVLAIFRDVLGTEDVTAGDNFFEAGGGGSVEAVRAAHAIEEHVLLLYGLDIAADALIFTHPTALELADEIDRGVSARLGS